jgi:hypothetical protein
MHVEVVFRVCGDDAFITILLAIVGLLQLVSVGSSIVPSRTKPPCFLQPARASEKLTACAEALKTCVSMQGTFQSFCLCGNASLKKETILFPTFLISKIKRGL